MEYGKGRGSKMLCMTNVSAEARGIQSNVEEWFQMYKRGEQITHSERRKFSEKVWAIFPSDPGSVLTEEYKPFYWMLENMLEPKHKENLEERLNFYVENGLLYIFSDVLFFHGKSEIWRLKIGSLAMRVLDILVEGRLSATAALGTVAQITGMFDGFKKRTRRLIFDYMEELSPAVFYYSLMNNIVDQNDSKVILGHLEARRAEIGQKINEKDIMSKPSFDCLKDRCYRYLTDPVLYSMANENGIKMKHFLSEDGCFSRIIPIDFSRRNPDYINIVAMKSMKDRFT